MAYEFTFTPRFQKHFKGLTALEKKHLKNKLELLAQNPSHPSLRTKRIQDTTDLFECSVNMNIRIIWYYEAEAAQYMLHKITCTGGSASIIEQPALSAVHSNS